MTEKRLIQGSYGVQRYLHSDEVFCKERNWNINLPNEREFKDGYCIITDKDNTAYSTDELVELLNEFQNENEQLKHDATVLIQANQDYRKENERLKHECNYLQSRLDDFIYVQKENEQLKKEKGYYKRELQKDLVCQAIIDGREKND